MEESRLTTLLAEASDEVAGQSFDPEDDLRRGRRAHRRRRTTALAAAALGSAAAVVAALTLSGQLTSRPEMSVGPAGGGPAVTAAATPVGSSTASSTAQPTSTSVSAPATATSEPTTVPPDPFGVSSDARDFLRMAFGVAQDHLDPAHDRLQWSEGFTGSPGTTTKEWGQKLGWQVTGETGQAMVYLAVGNIPKADRAPGCGQYDYQGSTRCRTVTLPNGQKAQVLDSTTRREVHWDRPDGSYVFVIVDAVFGNNTTVASKATLPTVAQLEEFVMDPRLVLPPG